MRNDNAILFCNIRRAILIQWSYAFSVPFCLLCSLSVMLKEEQVNRFGIQDRLSDIVFR